MTLVYIGAPVVVGYYMMEWTNKKAEQNYQIIKDAPQTRTGQLHVQYQKRQLEIMLNAHKPPESQ